MQVIEVKTQADQKRFLTLPLKIYEHDKDWIRPLDHDIEGIFDPAKNKFFRHGECVRWIVLDDGGGVVGRVAAFVDKKTANKNEQPTGGIGFFECVNEQQVAFALFDVAKQWLQSKGMEAMDGPINFGERDSWWGLQVQGKGPPTYKMAYNPDYYQLFFEAYGFKIYFKQFCYGLEVRQKLHDKFYERHQQIAADTNYKAMHISKSRLNKFAEDFRIIYNKAWVKHGSGKELDAKQVQLMFGKMKPIIDEKIIWYVYYKDEPVAFWINIPDINQYFKHFNGKFGWFEKLRFLWMVKQRNTHRFIGVVFGVVPEHQGKGVDSFMIVEGGKVIQKDRIYDEYEMNWIGDFNPKMISVAESLGTWKNRTFHTYRKLFDENKEFKRHPMI